MNHGESYTKLDHKKLLKMMIFENKSKNMTILNKYDNNWVFF